jgi:glycosyltransferase involved in cell wall biosynthesis
MQRVLLLIPNLSPGGAQNVFRQQLDYLQSQCFVIGCVFNWNGASSVQWPNVISLEVPAGKTVWSKVIFLRQRVLRLRAVKKAHSINTCISHLEGADYVNALAGGTGKRFFWIHGTKKYDQNIKGGLGWLRKRVFIPWLYRKADRIVCVSAGILDELKVRYPVLANRLVLIINGIDLASIETKAHDSLPIPVESLFKDYFVVITHCRLAKQKNLSGFIKIAHYLRRLSQIKWVIIGDGEELRQLVALAAQLNLPTYVWCEKERFSAEKHVFLLGYSANPYPYLAHADLFLMTSDWEGFPLALCEAMAIGLPSVSTNCATGPSEILAEQSALPVSGLTVVKHGVLIPRQAEESIIKKTAIELEHVLQDKDLLGSLATSGRQRVSHFTLSETNRLLWQIISAE